MQILVIYRLCLDSCGSRNMAACPLVAALVFSVSSFCPHVEVSREVLFICGINLFLIQDRLIFYIATFPKQVKAKHILKKDGLVRLFLSHIFPLVSLVKGHIRGET